MPSRLFARIICQGLWYLGRSDLAILHFAQLMGIAMGIGERRLGPDRLFVSPANVLAEV